MVFVWGSRGEVDFLGFIIQTCSACQYCGPFRVFQAKRRFTVYFVPTFSYSHKQFIECSSCKVGFEVPKDRKEAVANTLMSQEQLSELIARMRTESVPEQKPQAFRDACLILGVREDVTLEQVKQRYKEEASAWHPDRFEPGSKMHGRAQEKLKQLNNARSVLESFLRSIESEKAAREQREAENKERRAREADEQKQRQEEARRTEALKREEEIRQQEKSRQKNNTPQPQDVTSKSSSEMVPSSDPPKEKSDSDELRDILIVLFIMGFVFVFGFILVVASASN